MTTTVLCGTLIDGTGADPRQGVALEITDGLVTRIGPRAGARTAGATVIDLGDATVLPGLIDCHEHFGIDIGDEKAQCLEPLEYIVIRSVNNARTILAGGITTMRDVGEKGQVGQMMKRSIAEGLIPGPRVLTAGQPIMRTGGHGWYLGREVDGADALRRAVRDEIKAGADLIKLIVSGGVATAGSNVLAPEYSEEEVAAVVDEAHRRGRKVAAHGHGGEGVRMAVRAGADSIEHGAFLTLDDVQLMIEHGTYLVITAGIFYEIMADPQAPSFMKDKLGRAMDDFHTMLGRTKGTGLKVAVGTDENHGRLWREMKTLVDVGYEPMDALLAGTKHAADLLGLTDCGTLETGKRADLIAVAQDPLGDFERLSTLELVMKGGTVQLSRGAWQTAA
jgi:imidazolonepropionase-like amidohydrolase